MTFIIDTINGSGLYAQSAASACIATKDSNGNDITATYLTGVDLTPYQTTAGMTAYATTGDVANKLDTTAFSDVSGTFLTAHQSLDGYATTAWVDSQGYLTAHQPISADEWNNVYDTVNVYSGSWTGSESSPTASVDSYGSIDIVSSNNTVYFDINGTWFNDAVNSALPTSAVQWNSNYDTVNTNSGVWGGSALNISAGEGVKVTLVNNNLVFSTDETLLFSGSNYVSSCSLSEDLNNYKYIIVETPGASTHLCNERHTFKATNGIINLSYLAGANYPVIRNVRLSAYNSSLNVLSSVGITLGQWSGGNTATRYGNSDDLKSILAVYGINRINNA